MIEKAVQSGRLEIDVGEKNPIYGTVFDNQLAFQSYYNEKCYLISSIVKKILTLPEPLPAATEEDQQS